MLSQFSRTLLNAGRISLPRASPIAPVYGTRLLQSSAALDRRVLVGVDGAGYSDKAFHEACITIHKTNQKDDLYLFIVPALPTATYSFVFDESYSATLKQVMERSADEAKKILNDYKKKAVDEYNIDPLNVHAVIGLHMGSTRLELLNAVEEFKVDLLVLGSHGRGAMKKLFLGSTSDYLVHHAPCDVMICKLTSAEREKYEKLGMLDHPAEEPRKK
jgi:nucleotide-binding universal stress UspA family protein